MTGGQDGFAIQDGQTIVFIGDSITDCGRTDENKPFGDGYVRMAIDLITARYPQRRIRYHNKGINGDVSVGLAERWDEDVIATAGDWVSVMVGINDLNHCFAPDLPVPLTPETYRKAYDEFLTKTADRLNARLILMTPFYICLADGADDVERDTLNRIGLDIERDVLNRIGSYIAVVEEMAAKFDARIVPLHDIFQQQLAYRPADTFCPEPVHPNAVGHSVIANAWLDAMGW